MCLQVVPRVLTIGLASAQDEHAPVFASLRPSRQVQWPIGALARVNGTTQRAKVFYEIIDALVLLLLLFPRRLSGDGSRGAATTFCSGIALS